MTESVRDKLTALARSSREEAQFRPVLFRPAILNSWTICPIFVLADFPTWEPYVSTATLQSPSDSHPESVRLLSVNCWTLDPAVAVLIDAAHGLVPIGEKLRDLSVRRPSIDRLIADDIGAVVWEAAETGRVNVWRRAPRPSGLISLIWTELESLRSRWIATRLRFEGFSPTASDILPWYERLQALEAEAPTVAILWGDGATQRPQ